MLKNVDYKLPWWDQQAQFLHNGACWDTQQHSDSDFFTGAQVRQAVVHTRQDLVLCVSYLSSVNKQLHSTNRLLTSVWFVLIALTFVMIAGVVHQW
jgi:hypothetical protein